MIGHRAARSLLLVGAAVCSWASEEVVLNFQDSVALKSDGKANRFERWEEKGVVFTLTREPQQTKGKGMMMFFTHIATGRKGIVCAMATEPIPVRATFPKPVTSVSVSFWGSTGTSALLEAFDAGGRVVDRASLETIPGRNGAAEPVPIFTMKVKAGGIAYIQFSGPREGEYLVANEVRYTPLQGSPN